MVMNKSLSCLLLISLSACTVMGPDYKPPETHSASKFLATGGAVVAPSYWWQAFGDTQLNSLIQRALLGSQDLKLAEARLHQARAVQSIQAAALAPTLSLGGKVLEDQWSKNSEMLANIPSRNIRTQFTNYQTAFDASWEIDFFGRLHRLSEAAAARTEESKLHRQDVALIVAAEVARNYLEYRLSQQRLALAQDNLRNYQELLRLAKLVLTVGEGTEMDVQRAAANLNNYQASLTTLTLAMRQSLTVLQVLTGVDLAQLTKELQNKTPPLALPNPPAAGLPSDLLKRRPDVRAAEQELIATNAEIGAAIAERYPRFSLLGNAGWMSIHSGSLFNAASQAWSIGPTVTIPLFNNGRLKSQIKANRAAFEAALANYRKSLLSAVADVEVALTRVASSEEKRQQLLTVDQQQQRLLELAEQQMQNGELTQMAVLDARRNLVNQQDLSLQAHTQTLTALVALYKSLSGGF